jgi:hypothetical protein
MMRYSKLDQMIKEAAMSLFAEQQEQQQKPEEKAEKPKPKKSEKIKVDGAYGTGGRFKYEAAQTRADNDAAGLMRDLKVGTATGGTDLEKAASILSQAIRGNEIMSSAFSMPTVRTIGESKQVVVAPKSGELSQRNATKFLYFTLHAAERAGMLKLDDGIEFVNAAIVSVPTIKGL